MTALFVLHEGDQPALRRGVARAHPRRGRSRFDRSAQPQPRRGAGVQHAPADLAGAGLCPGNPSDALEAITVNVEDGDTKKLVHEWEDSDITVPLKVLASPYREVTGPVVDYVKRISNESARTVVTVFIPEYVVGHCGSTSCTTRARQAQGPAAVPAQRDDDVGALVKPTSSERVRQLEGQSAAGDVRRGFVE